MEEDFESRGRWNEILWEITVEEEDGGKEDVALRVWKKRPLKVEVVGSRRYWEVTLKEECGGKEDVGRYVGGGGYWKKTTLE